MDSLTYSLIIGSLFIVGVFFFTYFETPRQVVNKGIKKIRSVQFLNVGNNGQRRLTIGSERKENQRKKDNGDLKVFIHEY